VRIPERGFLFDDEFTTDDGNLHRIFVYIDSIALVRISHGFQLVIDIIKNGVGGNIFFLVE
jgi:hypothetical protein